MVTFVHDHFGEEATAKLSDEERAKLQKNVELVSLALAAEGHTKSPAFPLESVEAGRVAIVNEFACTDCHKFHETGEIGSAPDLTGWSSRDWLTAFISNPADKRFYGENNDRMPAFAAHADNAVGNRLSAEELAMLVAWLRSDWWEGAGPNPVDR
jgi:ubiquinol-cytochrome c reductase cytochrome b subunit